MGARGPGRSCFCPSLAPCRYGSFPDKQRSESVSPTNNVKPGAVLLILQADPSFFTAVDISEKMVIVTGKMVIVTGKTVIVRGRRLLCARLVRPE